MPDGIASRGAGVGNYGHRSGKPERPRDRHYLQMGLILADPGWLSLQFLWFGDRLTIILLPVGHPAAGSADNKRDILRRLPLTLLPCLGSSKQENLRRGIQTFQLTAAKFCRG